MNVDIYVGYKMKLKQTELSVYRSQVLIGHYGRVAIVFILHVTYKTWNTYMLLGRVCQRTNTDIHT